jgi:His-Xaa-Ser system protein HxsD
MTAVKKTAHRFSGRCAVSIATKDEHHVSVKLRVIDLAQPWADLEVAFERELLDQDLREEIGRQTESVRNLIVAHAFSRTSLLDPEGEDGNVDDDPLKITESDKGNA